MPYCARLQSSNHERRAAQVRIRGTSSWRGTTSSWAQAPPAAPSPRACRRTGEVACWCWKRVGRTGASPLRCRRPASSSHWATRATTGRTRRSRTRRGTGAAISCRAARCWAAPARSTACPMCAASRRTITDGPPSAAKAGTSQACCPTSSARRTTKTAPTPITARAAHSRSPTAARGTRCRRPISSPASPTA